jgi:hypothetical protein
VAVPNLLSPNKITQGIVVSTQLSSTSATSVYTVPSNSSATIKHGVLCNTSASAVTVSLSVVPSGGTASASNRIISGVSLPANSSISLKNYLEGAQLGAGDFISVTASVVDVLTVVLTGVVTQ